MDAHLNPRCVHCSGSHGWTLPAFSAREVLQIGCSYCGSLYNIVDEEYRLIGQRGSHYIFWKDLLLQWNNALKHIAASTVKTKAA